MNIITNVEKDSKRKSERERESEQGPATPTITMAQQKKVVRRLCVREKKKGRTGAGAKKKGTSRTQTTKLVR